MDAPRLEVPGFHLEHAIEIGSTSAALHERARAGEGRNLWLVADVQTGGRGRNQRSWSSPAGNLYASLLLQDPAPAGRLPELSFVLALALRDAVLAAASLHEDATLQLKWPNDLMLEGQKTAGLLLEGGQSRGVGFVVAGFGVNIISHPEGTAHKATHLGAGAYVLDRNSLFSALTDRVAFRLAQWNRGQGFPVLRDEWLARAYGRGSLMRVSTLSETFEGIFETVDSVGHLVVGTSRGPRVVSAGDVFVLGAAGGEYAA